MKTTIVFTLFFCLLTLVSGRCVDDWIEGYGRCYINLGASKFSDGKVRCDEQGAEMVSILSEEDNSFLFEVSDKKSHKWLGLPPSSSHPKLRNSDLIFWLDLNIGNYSNFHDQPKRCQQPCCVSQFYNGSWGLKDCDFQLDVWCYISVEESNRRLVANLENLTKSAKEILDIYPLEQLRSDNIKRLSALLEEIRDAIHAADNQMLTGNIVLSQVSLVLSTLALFIVLVLLIRSKNKRKPRNDGGMKRTSFTYSEPGKRLLKPLGVNSHISKEYVGHERGEKSNSYEGNLSYDSPNFKPPTPPFATSEAVDL